METFRSFNELATANGVATVNSFFTATNNSKEGFNQLIPKIEEFKRNPRHGEDKAVSGTLTRRIAAAVGEIVDIDDTAEQKACAKRLLAATEKVEGGTRHASDSIRANVPNMFGFNPYSDQAKSALDTRGISYNARYADAMSIINSALDSLGTTQNVAGLREIFNSLAIENNDIEGGNTADEAKDAIVGDPTASPIDMRERMHVLGTETEISGGTEENIEESNIENNNIVDANTADDANDAVVGTAGATPMDGRDNLDIIKNNDVVGAFTADEGKDAVVGNPGASPVCAREKMNIVK